MTATNRDLFAPITASVVRGIDELFEVMSVRAMVYVDDQHCPFREEFDGNDLSSTHLIARCGDEPVGTMRIRWFADFAKFERICVRTSYRGSDAVRLLLQLAYDLTARKGFERVIAHIERTLIPYWERHADLSPRANRPPVVFSDREYIEVERVLGPHPKRIGANTSALVLVRPEGDWDRKGVLDRSLKRGAAKSAARGR